MNDERKTEMTELKADLREERWLLRAVSEVVPDAPAAAPAPPAACQHSSLDPRTRSCAYCGAGLDEIAAGPQRYYAHAPAAGGAPAEVHRLRKALEEVEQECLHSGETPNYVLCGITKIVRAALGGWGGESIRA